jgi:hypothetical protein
MFWITKMGQCYCALLFGVQPVGQLVFSTKSSTDCWDGKLNGMPQQPGNFVYKVKAETPCGIVEISGNVLLVR